MALTFKVPDIGCQNCADKITASIHSIEADAKVDVDVAAKIVMVDSQKSESSIRDAIASAGFEVENS